MYARSPPRGCDDHTRLSLNNNNMFITGPVTEREEERDLSRDDLNDIHGWDGVEKKNILKNLLMVFYFDCTLLTISCWPRPAGRY